MPYTLRIREGIQLDLRMRYAEIDGRLILEAYTKGIYEQQEEGKDLDGTDSTEDT